MIPLLKKFWDKLLHDELSVQRWGRAIIMAIAGSGFMYADKIGNELGGETAVTVVKVISIVCGALALIITAGEKNPKPEQPPAEEPKP